MRNFQLDFLAKFKILRLARLIYSYARCGIKILAKSATLALCTGPAGSYSESGKGKAFAGL